MPVGEQTVQRVTWNHFYLCVTMIKADLVGAVISKTGMSKNRAELAVNAVIDNMKHALTRGERIELRGFGIFTVRPRKTGIGRNPKTGAAVAIRAGRSIRFKSGKELRNLD